MRVVVDSLAYGGDGIATLDDGRTAFVSGSCPGDIVEIDILSDHGRYVKAVVRSVTQPSLERIDPPCPFFGECGGCQWQHIAYPAQLAAKRTAVTDALQRIGGLDPSPVIDECMPSPQQFGYRNKIELLAEERSGRLNLGFARVGTDEVMPIPECMLLPQKLRKAPAALQGALRYLSSRSRDLRLLRVSLRVAANTGDIEVALWTEPGPFPRQIAADTLSEAVGASSVVRCLVKGPPKKRDVSSVEVLKGKGAWRERLTGRSMLASAPSFFQVNTPMAEELIRIVLEAATEDSTAEVLDLFCGAGTFTLPLAAEIDDVTCVESSRYALKDLRRNLDAADLQADVIAGDAAREISGLGEFDVVVVDPPRAGLTSQLIEAIGNMNLSRLVYVSCDPSTLARDAAILDSEGLRLRNVKVLDLFPQTYHVETVAEFSR